MTTDAQFLLDNSVEITPGAFPLGATMALVGPELTRRDTDRRLGLAGLLDSTPYKWVWLDGYRIGRSMVTNGEYLQFLRAQDSGYEEAGLWHHIWTVQGRRIESHTRYDQGADGQVHRQVEQRAGARNFVEAYIDSLFDEVTQWSQFENPDRSIPDDETASGDGTVHLDAIARSRAIRRVFDFAKACLAEAIVPAGSDDDILLPKPQAAIGIYYGSDGRDELRRDISAIRKLTVQRLIVQVPPIQRPKLERFPHEIVEAIAFLRRLHKAWLRHDAPHKLPLSEVLYPRTWPGPGGEPDSAGIGIPKVPWKDRPVFGITLYEAAAYCAWLSRQTGWKMVVDLPSEAQYERAASWSNHHPQDSGGVVRLDPRKKALFPWQEHSEQDFNDFFGQEQATLERLHADPEGYHRLLHSTSHRDGEGHRIDQLLGFGWQWCSDRFDTAERRYARFQRQTYQTHPDIVVEEYADDSVHHEIFIHKPNSATQHPYFVVRGAPEVLGGPGLTTRRFAMFPLRAYPNVGFRWIVTQGTSAGASG